MSIIISEGPVIKHQGDFFRDGFLSMTIIGKSGCGKTRLLTSILPSISENIKTVVVATLVHNNACHIAIVKYFKDRGLLSGIVEDPEELRTFTRACEEMEEVTPDRQGLIIFDDFNNGKATGPYWDATIHCFTKLRNAGWNFIILAQYPSFIPPIIRNCTTCRILFNCYSKSAVTTFLKDIIERVPDRDNMSYLIDYIQSVPFTYIMVRENPFEICAGKLDNVKTVMTEHDVMMPTMKELLKEMGVSSRTELDAKSKFLQMKAGNTSSKLYT